jgi:hypothetical protein
MSFRASEAPPVIPSERSPPMSFRASAAPPVIPSERSESRNLHFPGSRSLHRDFHAEAQRSAEAQRTLKGRGADDGRMPTPRPFFWSRGWRGALCQREHLDPESGSLRLRGPWRSRPPRHLDSAPLRETSGAQISTRRSADSSTPRCALRSE